MKPFALTAKARADLHSIGLVTQKHWGKEQRNRYLKQLDDTFRLLAGNPQAGMSCDEIRPGYRKFPRGSHVIFYRSATDCVIEIVRILHRSMDLETGMTAN